jgi:hypothetical protein
MTRWRIAWPPLLALLVVATRTATAAPCPSAGAVTIVADHRTATGTVSLSVSGSRIASAGECEAAAQLATSYDTTVPCTGPGMVRCGSIEGLAPGLWVHRVALQVPGSASQEQAQRGLVLAGDASNVVEWTVYGRTVVVDAVTPLPAAIDAAAAFTASSPLPALIRFDRALFPGASSPVTIALQTAPACVLDTCQPDQRQTAYCFEGSDVTVDALDDDGLPGGVGLGIGTCNNSVLRLYGRDNVLRGLVLVGSTDPAPAVEVDTIVVAGAAAGRNRLEQCEVRGPTLGDGVSVEDQAGAENETAANVVVDSEVFGAQDKGVKAVGGGVVRVERSCVHDNAHGGIQATNGGTVIAVENTVQHNLGTEPDPAPEHGLLVGVPNDAVEANALTTRGNVVRFNGGRGISVVNNAVATLRDDVVSDNFFAGLRVETTLPGVTPAVSARGVAFVCNHAPGLCENEPGKVCRVDADCALMSCNPGSGMSAANGLGVGLHAEPGTSPASVDLGLGGVDPGRNALTLNANAAAVPAGINLRTDLVLPAPVSAAGNQWEHCDDPNVDPVNPNRCYVAQVAVLDVEVDPGAAAVNFGTPIGPRHGPDPVVTGVSPARPRAGDLVRVYGGSFNAIDGAACHPGGLPADPCSAENPAAVLVNAESVSQGNHATITIDGRAFDGPVHQVTPTMLVFEMPVDCYAPAVLTVARGNDVAAPVLLCDPDGCAGRPIGALCDDHDVCTIGETCQASGACVAASVLECTGPCETGVCDPVDGCVLRPAGGACEDGNACTSGDQCLGGADVCVPGGPTVCQGPCLTGACAPASGCVPRPATAACSDGDACTRGDHCSGGDDTCTGTPVDCDDENPCTVDACGAGGACTHAPLDGPACPAADACHGAGACDDGACAAGAAIDCDDGAACTEDGCDPIVGCVHAARTGLDGVTCHTHLLEVLVDALGAEVGKLARRAGNQVDCATRHLADAGRLQAGSLAQKRRAKKARTCLQRFVRRVSRSRLSSTQRALLVGEAEAAITALEAHFFGF